MKEASSRTDLELVREFQDGREGAFDELVKRHMTKAIRLAHAVCGNYEDARDLSQEAFVKAHRALARFEGRAEFSTWFYRILMNTAKDFMRSKNWKRLFAWKDQESQDRFFEGVEESSARSPVHIVAGAELDQKITASIRKLPHKQQWVFVLRFLDELSIGQIAQVTGQAEGTVKATLHFAVKKFEQEITPYLSEGGRK